MYERYTFGIDESIVPSQDFLLGEVGLEGEFEDLKLPNFFEQEVTHDEDYEGSQLAQ